MPEINLTKTEQVAKDFILDLMFDGLSESEPCDESLSEDDFKLPTWFDEEKFKRGQKYFLDNRCGIMTSNLYGLFSLICEPQGAKLLDRTQQSSTPETAKKRYISTTVHMLSWYYEELKPGSKSWESLKRVRRMHLMASRQAAKTGYGMIPQCAMSMTNFGFMGYALIKPHLLGIRHDNDEDREAFVFFWAVIGYMLGIKDRFNMCLFPLEVVETICRIFLRYAFIPFLQLESPTFIKLGKAFVDGMGSFIPFSSYESRVFMARRLAGVPGYQYDVDLSKEVFQRQIFNADELKRFVEEFQKVPHHEYRRHFVFDEKMYLLEINRLDEMKHKDGSEIEASLDNMDENRNVFGHYKNLEDNNNSLNPEEWNDEIIKLMEFLGVNDPSELSVTEVQEDNYEKYLNDRKFKELSERDKRLVKIAIHQTKMFTKRMVRPLYEMAMSFTHYQMDKFMQNQKA